MKCIIIIIIDIYDFCACQHNSYLHCLAMSICTRTYTRARFSTEIDSLTHTYWYKREKRMWKDGVIVKHTPLYLYLPHTAQHKAACPFSLCFLSIAHSLQSYMKGIRQARRAECRVTAANGVMAQPDKHPASNEKALRLPSSPVTMQLLNRVIAR